MSFIKLRHLYRLISQIIYKPDIAIIGGYHGGNLGDMALGYSVKSICDEKGLSSSLQTIYNIDMLKWNSPKVGTIVGGGAIAYEESLKKLRKKMNNDYSKLIFLGVDFNEEKYSTEDIAMLKESLYLSCRSERQVENLKTITQREDIYFYPDLVFSYNITQCKKYRNNVKLNKILLNIVPLYGSFDGEKVVPNLQYKDERPEIFVNHSKLIEGYIRNIKEVVSRYRKLGYSIETISFTQADYDFAKYVLNESDVKHHSYSDRISKIMKIMSDSEILYATRYHATILGAKLGVKIIPMAYAKKNENLFVDFGFSDMDFNTPEDFINDKVKINSPLHFDNGKVEYWENLAKKNIENALDIIVRD